MPETRAEKLMVALRGAQSSVAGLEATAVVSIDGLVIASSLPPDIEEERVAAMTAAMLGLGERTANEMKRGGMDQLFLKGPLGYVVIMSASEIAVLTAIANADVKLGLLFLELKNLVQQLEPILKG
ncbi:hypothetical protein GX441_11510 [bacterium]|jgi:predicted regulator of Ras-like GTPase activity (Roadblock/LC7/MglB family)|nr:hypothetical protein [bacterium]